MPKPKVIVKKSVATRKKKPVTKIVVHDPDPVVEIVVHDPTFLERIEAWLKENFG
jgi:hypothetical protein